MNMSNTMEETINIQEEINEEVSKEVSNSEEVSKEVSEEIFLTGNFTQTEETFDSFPISSTQATVLERKIEPSKQFGDLKTTKHLTKMNSNIMQSITEIFNAEILKFAKRVNAEYPSVPVNEMLTIWCRQQKMPMSTFDLEEGGDDVYDAYTEIDEEPVSKVVKTKKKKSKNENDKEEIPQSHRRIIQNGVASDIEDDVRSSDEEVEHGKQAKNDKKKRKAIPKKEGEKCHHMYIKGKNSGTKCVTTVKGDGNYCSKHKQKKAT